MLSIEGHNNSKFVEIQHNSVMPKYILIHFLPVNSYRLIVSYGFLVTWSTKYQCHLTKEDSVKGLFHFQ
jgi:hypothetical protein